MRKLPNGISNYEDIVQENRIYVDKTMYIEKLENLEDKTIMFLRPRKFGKTLFTSVLENYYDISKKDKFDTLFASRYIGKNPTPNKNKYHILRFNFSGIDTSSEEATIQGFKREVASSIGVFVEKYRIDFYVNINDEAEYILDNLFKAFYIQKSDDKIYVMIDEYDHFANELLGFEIEKFKKLVSKNGKIRKWYEILKKGTETVVDRIFITGVAPITLDSTTSGFNIARNITKDLKFNDMLGFSKQDVIYIMNELEIHKKEQEKLLPIIKENYDGYVFTDYIDGDLNNYKLYNSNMTLYFLSQYMEYERIPKNLTDTNIISDYRKIEGFINLCKATERMDILEKIVGGEKIASEITEKFNAEISFGEKELVSLLFYLGYLTISGQGYSKYMFKAPNNIIRKIYTEYFLEYISRTAEISTSSIDTEKINYEVLETGKIDMLLDLLKEYLTRLSNRDYKKFDEKYVKIIFFTLANILGTMIVDSELETEGVYSDILMVPLAENSDKYSVLIEFKYIKKEDYSEKLLCKKQEEAESQLKKYVNTQKIKNISKLKVYSIVAVKNELFVKEYT